jgi:hypothetical protein
MLYVCAWASNSNIPHEHPYVHIYVCVYIVCMYMHGRVTATFRMNTYVYVCVYVCMYMHEGISTMENVEVVHGQVKAACLMNTYVYICVYVCMYVCMYVCRMYVCAWASNSDIPHEHLCVHIYVCMCVVCMYMHGRVTATFRMNTCVYVCVCMYMHGQVTATFLMNTYVYVCVCVCVCIKVYRPWKTLKSCMGKYRQYSA